MSRLASRIEVTANIAIISIALLLGGLLVRNYFFGGANVMPRPIPTGTQVALPDVDWQKHRQTLLLALSTDCHYCTESAPFYQRLMKEIAGKGDIQVIALLPQDVPRARTYLDTLAVPIKEIRQTSLSKVHVVGTPTIILVDNRAAVTGSWIGKLTADQETEVLERLRGTNGTR